MTKMQRMARVSYIARRHGLSLDLTEGDLVELLEREALIDGKPIPEWALGSVVADDGWPRFMSLLNRAETMARIVENPENIEVAIPAEKAGTDNRTIQAVSRVSFALQATADYSMLLELGLKQLREVETSSPPKGHDLCKLFDQLEPVVRQEIDQNYRQREGEPIRSLLARHKRDREAATYLRRQREPENEIEYEPSRMRTAAEIIWSALHMHKS